MAKFILAVYRPLSGWHG